MSASPDPATGPQDVLLNYGAIGAILVLAFLAITFLFRYVIAAHARERQQWLDIRKDEREAAQKRESDLNDRNEKLNDELNKLQEAFREKYTNVLGEATRAVTDALDVVRELRRTRRHDNP